MRRVDEDRVVRPTLRCLFEDLANEVGPPELQDVLSGAAAEMREDPLFLFPVPLTSADHLVLRKANLLASDPAADREPIRTLFPERVAKVKAGDRRGALWQDEHGVWWLLAAGVKKPTGSDAFYAKLERSNDPFETIKPTGKDEQYLRYEESYLEECARERDAHRRVLQAVIFAAGNPGTRRTVEVFGARIAVIVDVDDDPAELALSFEFASFKERDRFPTDILAFVPGCNDLNQWEYLPAFRPGDPESWYTFIDATTLETWSVASELEELVDGPERPPSPVVGTDPDVAHVAPASLVTLGYVEGVEISAICGARFTPHRIPENFDICVACTTVVEGLRLARSSRAD